MFNFCDYEWNSVQLDTTNHAGWVFCWSCVWSDTLFCHSFLVPRVGRVEPMNFLYPFSVAFPASISSGRGSKLCFEIFYRRSGREGIPIALTTSLVAIFAKLFWKLLLHRMAPSYPNKSIKALGGRYLRPPRNMSWTCWYLIEWKFETQHGAHGWQNKSQTASSFLRQHYYCWNCKPEQARSCGSPLQLLLAPLVNIQQKMIHSKWILSFVAVAGFLFWLDSPKCWLSRRPQECRPAWTAVTLDVLSDLEVLGFLQLCSKKKPGIVQSPSAIQQNKKKGMIHLIDTHKWCGTRTGLHQCLTMLAQSAFLHCPCEMQRQKLGHENQAIVKKVFLCL